MWVSRLFNIRWHSADGVKSNVAFSKEDFAKTVKQLTSLAIAVSSLGFLFEIGKAYYRTFESISTVKWQTAGISIKVVFNIAASFWLFTISLVPFTNIESETHQNLWPVLHRWYRTADQYQIVNSYGLFRR